MVTGASVWVTWVRRLLTLSRDVKGRLSRWLLVRFWVPFVGFLSSGLRHSPDLYFIYPSSSGYLAFWISIGYHLVILSAGTHCMSFTPLSRCISHFPHSFPLSSTLLFNLHAFRDSGRDPNALVAHRRTGNGVKVSCMAPPWAADSVPPSSL